MFPIYIQYNYIFQKPPVYIRHVRLITIRGKYTYKHNISNSDLFGLRVVVWTPNEGNTIVIVHSDPHRASAVTHNTDNGKVCL